MTASDCWMAEKNAIMNQRDQDHAIVKIFELAAGGQPVIPQYWPLLPLDSTSLCRKGPGSRDSAPFWIGCSSSCSGSAISSARMSTPIPRRPAVLPKNCIECFRLESEARAYS